MRKDIENNRSKIEKHEIDFSVHMPFEKKIEVFVPRVELDGRIENIEKSLIRIEKKLDK